MTRVMAQGTFDVLHPGHVYYFRESARLGDELHVVIARDSRMRSHKDIFMDEESRRIVVDALEMVDRAVLGSEGSIYETVARIEPDVITLGHDQSFDPDELAETLEAEGFPGISVVRIGRYEGQGVTASSDVKAAIRRRLGDGAFRSVVDREE